MTQFKTTVFTSDPKDKTRVEKAQGFKNKNMNEKISILLKG